MNPRITRRLAAVLVAAIGLMNIVSAVHPAVHTRVELLLDLESIDIVRGSQTAAVLSGFILILLADGLWKRRKRAMQMAVCVLTLSMVFHLTKGLDFEEAILTGILGSWLWARRDVFNVQCRTVMPFQFARHLGEAFVLYWSYVLLGFVILHHAVRPAPTLTDVLAEPFRLVAGTPHFVYATEQARWFGDSLILVASVFVVYMVALALRPFIPLNRPTSVDIERARGLVERYGADTLSYFALQDGRSIFFHPSGTAFLSYRLWGNVALVGGGPIGDSTCVRELVEMFLDYTEASGLQPCFLGISDESRAMYRDMGLRLLKIGEEALIDLPSFDPSSLKRKVRRAVRHIEDMGITVSTFRAGEVPSTIAEQVEEISRAWMDIKGGAERGFSMTLGRFPRAEDRDCEISVALQDDIVLGFLSVVPVYGIQSWSLDAMRRRPDSPNGLMEFLVVRLAEQYRDRGFQRLSLNFASLANSANDIDSRMLEETRRFIFENLSSFYQLKSLAQFNNKFAPQWRSRFLAYGDVLTFPKLVLAVVQSEDPIKLPRRLTGRREVPGNS